MRTQIVAFLTGICCLILLGCEGVAIPPEQIIPEVTVSEPVQREVIDYAEFTGRVQSIETVDIRARVKGFLKSVNFVDGAMVEKGQLLFVIEQEPFKATLDAAEAKKLQTLAAQRLARANLDRATDLRKKDVITLEDYQTKVAELEAAEAQLKADEAAIEQAKIDLGYTEIYSPITGLAGEKLVDPGNLVGADENTLLTTVVRIDEMYAYFDVSEGITRKYLQEIANRLKQGKGDLKTGETSPVFLSLDGEEGYPHEGHLDYLDNVVDPATGTGMVRGLFPNPDRVMRPGMYARLRVPRKLQAQDDALLVKEEALNTAPLGVKYLLIVADEKMKDGKDRENIVSQRNVELGVLIDGMRVIRSGIEPGERYVSNGMQFARPGMPVNPTLAAPDPKPESTSPAKKPAPKKDVEQSKPAEEPDIETPTETRTP